MILRPRCPTTGKRRMLRVLGLLLALGLYAAAQPVALTPGERVLLPQIRPGTYVTTTTWLDVLDTSATTVD